MKRLLSLQFLALPLTCAQLAFSLNTFVTNWFLARASAEAFHAALPGSMLAVAVSALAISTLGYSGTILARRHRTLTVFRIQFGSSLLFWVPLFLTVRALHPTIPALWLTMVACSALSTFLLARQTA